MHIAHSGQRSSHCVAFVFTRDSRTHCQHYMTTPDDGPAESRTRTASIVLLGTDAVLAARPATAVQLAHACLQAGFAAVIPPSWGDELLASETMRQLSRRRARPVVYCACPRVSERLLEVGDDLAPFLLPLVPPPVAAARYLREIAGDKPLSITFVGRCPAGSDPSIDVHLTPDAFLEQLAERDIALATQPVVFDAVLAPDRRRHRSLPGGVPTPEMLWSQQEGRALIEIDGDEPLTDLAQHLASGEDALVDLAPSLECSCSGVEARTSPRSVRGAIMSLEPPRSASDVIDVNVRVQLMRSLPNLEPARHAEALASVAHAGAPDASRHAAGGPSSAGSTHTSRAAAGNATHAAQEAGGDATMTTTSDAIAKVDSERAGPPAGGDARRSPRRGSRAASWFHTTAQTSDGRPLPRAYLARRRLARSATGHSAAPETTDGSITVRATQAKPVDTEPSAGNGRSRDGASAPARDVAHQAVSGRLFASVPIAGTRPAARDPDRAAAPAVESSEAFETPAMTLGASEIELDAAQTTAAVIEPSSGPASDPAAEPAAEPASEPSVEPSVEPASESAPEPASEPASESSPEPAPEPASESAPDPASEAASEPASTSAPAFEPTSPPRSSRANDPETILVSEVRGAVDEIVGLLGSALGTVAGLVRETIGRDRDDQTGPGS